MKTKTYFSAFLFPITNQNKLCLTTFPVFKTTTTWIKYISGMGSHADPHKWRMPGWRIEQRYAKNVLIGNWEEERRKFEKNNLEHNSTNRIDFQNFGQFRPDVSIRRKAQRQNDGLGQEFIFYHHGKKYCNNMISWYDEQYNYRQRDPENALPSLRHWDGHKMSWVPEKSDHPLQGAPTNFGLYDVLKTGWEKEAIDESRGEFNTTYGSDYLKHQKSALNTLRYAVPREESTSLNPVNRTNKCMNLRGKPIFQQPELIPKLPNISPTFSS